nr:hypothetical protein [Tanacetum cinerariifolium]
MPAPVISISSNVSVESVGSSFPRVILIGSISVEVSIALEVGEAAVASPVEVLELDTHLSSEADPLESSPPPISVAHMVLPFLCSNDSKSDTEIPERHLIFHLHLLFPHAGFVDDELFLSDPRRTFPLVRHPGRPCKVCKALTARKSVRPLPFHHLALSYTSHHLDHFTSGSSSSHSSLDYSLSRHSSSGHSLSKHTLPYTTNADSSTPPRFVHLPLARAPRCSEAYLRWRPASLSTMYLPTTSESSARDSSSESSARPSRKRCRSLAEDSVEEDINTDVLEDIKADATAVEVIVDRDVKAEIDAGISMEVNVGIDVEDEVESNDRGTMEVGVDMDAGIDISDGMLMLDIVERLEQVKEGLQDIYDHVIEIPLQRIENIETTQRQLEAGQLITSGERAGLSDRTRSLEWENLKVRALLSIERDRVDSGTFSRGVSSGS